jgi:hypothetical protein
MKIRLLLCLLLLITVSASAQKNAPISAYGNTLNLGLGVGYYGYMGSSSPAFHINYEIDVVKNLTLAPFITVLSYSNRRYWGNNNFPSRYYRYTETVIPIGVKGTYYFDDLLNLNSKWDVYGAGSLGFAIRRTTWENGYDGERSIDRRTGNIYLDVHLGVEYHVSQKVGIFFDLSTGVSTVGLAFKLK